MQVEVVRSGPLETSAVTWPQDTLLCMAECECKAVYIYFCSLITWTSLPLFLSFPSLYPRTWCVQKGKQSFNRPLHVSIWSCFKCVCVLCWIKENERLTLSLPSSQKEYSEWNKVREKTTREEKKKNKRKDARHKLDTELRTQGTSVHVFSMRWV